MDNPEIAAVFRRIADLLELKEENPFKIRSFRLAADTIADYHEPIAQVAAAGAAQLQQIDGIGKSISSSIIELINTGNCTAYRNIVAEIPETTLDLLKVRGIGLKTAQRLFRDFQITNLDKLAAFAKAGKLTVAAGMSQKSVDKILQSLAELTCDQH